MTVSAIPDWAGRDYQADDKFTELFNRAVVAYRQIEDRGSSQYCTGLVHAYALVTGDPFHVVRDQVAKAAEETVPS